LTNLTEFRNQKDHFYKYNEQSPLTPDQKMAFDGLKYFPENTGVIFELDIDEFPEKETIQMQTSTGDIQIYKRFGKIHFLVNGEEAELTVYASANGFFLPFVDSQAGKETYGAGRYLDPHLLPNGKLQVDFNYSYNPYCAYNDLFSCPLTPAENRLPIAINAGEKVYK